MVGKFLWVQENAMEEGTWAFLPKQSSCRCDTTAW